MIVNYRQWRNVVALSVYNCNKCDLFTAVAPNYLPLESKTST